MYMETFIATLKPFSQLTDGLSNSQSVSIANVMPLLTHIEKVCAQDVHIDVSEECKAVSTDIRSKIWTYIDKRSDSVFFGNRLLLWLDSALSL